MGDASDWLNAYVVPGSTEATDGLFAEWLAYTTLGAVWTCLGIVFLLVQQRTVASVGLCAGCIMSGIGLITIVPLIDQVDPASPGLWPRLQILVVSAAIAGWALYSYGLLATATSGPSRARAIRLALHGTIVLAGANLVLGLLYPAERFNDYHGALGASDWSTTGFWLFAWVWVGVAICFAVAQTLLWGAGLDGGERTRAVGNLIAAALWCITTAATPRLALLCVSAALVVALYGQFRFLVTQGERGAFLSRFLSTQVSDLVRSEGFAEVMKPHEVELTVVACDLRGFTAYAEAVPSQAVIDLLGEYYDAVGDAVAAHGGTIKDYAGDGVLVLVGAPLPRPDHALAGLALASELLAATRPAVQHWSTGIHPLGVGLGVASGRVTVGAIGSTARMEYTAVGTAVNLAARLCSAAADGEILVDHRTVELAGTDDVAPRGSLQVRGLSSDQAVYAVLA